MSEMPAFASPAIAVSPLGSVMQALAKRLHCFGSLNVT
jgi:hypothetical protein